MEASFTSIDWGQQDQAIITDDPIRSERPARLLKLLAVPVIKILIPHGAVLATTHPVSITSKPPVEPIDQRPHEREPEQPRDQPALRQDFQQLLERRSRLPRPTIARPYHLHDSTYARAGIHGTLSRTPGVCEGMISRSCPRSHLANSFTFRPHTVQSPSKITM